VVAPNLQENTHLIRKANKHHELGAGFLLHKRIISVIRTVEFATVAMLYLILKGSRCQIIVLNVHSPRGDKN
jgi:hypothetical protein